MITRAAPCFAGLIGALLVSMAPASAITAGGGLASIRDQIEQAYDARDNQALEVARQEMLSAGRSTGQDDLAAYYAAYARFRQSMVAGQDDRRARDYLEDCINEVQAVLQRRPDFAEAHALLGSCLGASSSYYMLRAATRGLQASREMATAVRLAPDHPWVVFQDGVSDFSTPVLFGGSNARALEKLQRAAQLFVAARPPGSSEPLFGETQTWLYIGRVYKAQGLMDKAREALQRSLSYAPGNTDAREELAGLKAARL